MVVPEYRDTDVIGQAGGKISRLLQPAAVNTLFAAAWRINKAYLAFMNLNEAGAQRPFDTELSIGI